MLDPICPQIFLYFCNLSQIFLITNGGTALPIWVICFVVFPHTTKLSGKLCICFSSFTVKHLKKFPLLFLIGTKRRGCLAYVQIIVLLGFLMSTISP